MLLCRQHPRIASELTSSDAGQKYCTMIGPILYLVGLSLSCPTVKVQDGNGKCVQALIIINPCRTVFLVFEISSHSTWRGALPLKY
jgi:hypothetical protein